MDIFKWLDDASLVDSYQIYDFRQSSTASYLNLKIIFVDRSELHVKEYMDETHRKYAFHWQTASGDLICRWDNAPHFPQIFTFPHHKHLASGEVLSSFDIAFDDILKSIKNQIYTT